MSQTQSNSEFLPARNILQQAIYMPYVAGRNNASYVIMRGDSCTMPVAEGPGVSPAFQCVAVRLVWCTVEKAAILVPQWRHKLAALHHTGRCSTKGCSLRCKMTATMLFSCWCMVRRGAARTYFSLDDYIRALLRHLLVLLHHRTAYPASIAVTQGFKCS